MIVKLQTSRRFASSSTGQAGWAGHGAGNHRSPLMVSSVASRHQQTPWPQLTRNKPNVGVSPIRDHLWADLDKIDKMR